MPSFKSIPTIFGKLRRGDQMVPPQHFRAPKSPVQIGLKGMKPKRKDNTTAES